MRAAALLILTLLAAACSPAPGADMGPDMGSAGAAPRPEAIPVQDGPGQSAPAPTAAERQACDARGGRMQQVGMLQSWSCVVRYADAGKRCTDGDQCEGDCRVADDKGPFESGAPAEGRCQADSNIFGCHFAVEDGRVAAGLCVD